MSDMVFAPAFAELETEREVVLEEIAMYEDAPQELVHDLIADAVFGDHPLGRPVIGTAEVISSIPSAAIARYHEEMYVPSNIVVAAAGNIEHERVVELVQQGLGRREGNGLARANLRPPLVQAPPPQLRFQRKDTEQYHVCLAAPGISRSDRRRFAASLLDAILGGSASSRLFQEIREKRGMAYAVYSFVSQYTDTGQVGVYLGTREDNLGDALAITAEQIADIAAGNLTAPELDRAKENLKGRILLSMESTSTRMNRLGKSLITDSELLSLDRIVAEIDAVEASSVCELAARAALAGAAVGGLHRPERGAVPRRARADHTRPRARGVRVLLNGRSGKVGSVLAPGLEAAGHVLVRRSRRRRRDGRLHPARRRRCERPGGGRRRRPERRRHDRLGHGRVRERAGDRLLRAELRDRRGLDDALRRGGRPAPRAGRDRRAAPRREGRRPVGHGEADGRADGRDVPIHSVRLPGLNAHQEVILGGPGQVLTIRHDVTSREAYTPGVLLALERLPALPPGLTVGLDALL